MESGIDGFPSGGPISTAVLVAAPRNEVKGVRLLKRSERWKHRKFVMTGLVGQDRERRDVVLKWQADAAASGQDAQPRFTIGEMIRSSQELAFDVVDGKPTFYMRMLALDTDRMMIRADSTFQILVGKSDDPKTVADEIRSTLAMAAGFEVPVYPNSEEIAPLLAKYQREMLLHGFTAPSEKGERVRLELVRSPGVAIDDPEHIKTLKASEWCSPADLLLIRDAVSRELDRRARATLILGSLRLAISDLETILAESRRNEARLQQCLTANPILFGSEYTEVVPKHSLGSEYEMDYALRRHSGIYDLVEIEASTHPLFTKAGDPSNALVHAEQQVLDWLDWIERNHAYARERMPGLVAPTGFVVIGRSERMVPKDSDRIRRRNATWRGSLVILTYDDLLDRARGLLGILEGSRTP